MKAFFLMIFLTVVLHLFEVIQRYFELEENEEANAGMKAEEK